MRLPIHIINTARRALAAPENETGPTISLPLQRLGRDVADVQRLMDVTYGRARSEPGNAVVEIFTGKACEAEPFSLQQ
jgi:regulator of extracellular matrix RemA (YlzA/DUF370 family)